MDLQRFHTALMKVGRVEGSAETSNFTLTMSMRYRFDPEALVDDAEDLRTWSSEILHLARLAHVAGDFDLPSFLVVEALVAEFHDALTAAITEIAAELEEDRLDGFTDHGFDADDDEPLDAGFFAELDTDLDDATAEMLNDEFWSIVDAEYIDADGECHCPACTAASDAFELESATRPQQIELAQDVAAVATEAYITSSSKAQHPSMRAMVEQYAQQWNASYTEAVLAGPYELASFVVRFTDLCDDTMFTLFAKNASTDGFSSRSKDVLAQLSKQLALV